MAFTAIVTSKSQGTDKMKDLAAKIHKGAVDFLITEYKFLACFVLFIFTAVACLIINTQANVRTTQACDPASGGSINEGLKVAFKSGAVMGLGVTGLGLLGLATTYIIYIAAGANEADTWQYLSGFGA